MSRSERPRGDRFEPGSDTLEVSFTPLEDETGLINVVVSKGCWIRHRTLARSAPALLVHGRLERNEGVVNIIAERLAPLPLHGAPRSRDFR